MKSQIWRILAQILYYRNDLASILRPFFQNLENENINDKKYNSLLKTFSHSQIEVLYQNRFITEENFNSIMSMNQKQKEIKSSEFGKVMEKMEDIISGDKINELQEIIEEKDFNGMNIIIKSFIEVDKMEIPVIQYCIMKNAIACFKYLLINGYDDPNKIMKEHNPVNHDLLSKKYEWDCMATAIYFGKKEIVKILEDKDFEIGKNPVHIEAAILSYRNIIAKDIIDEMIDKNQVIVNNDILTSEKNNNIKGIELVINKKGADINTRKIDFLQTKYYF